MHGQKNIKIVHTCTCVCMCTPWPIDNWALGTPNNALYLPIGASPHLKVTTRSKCNRLRIYCMLGSTYDLLFLLTRHHIMDSLYANFVSPCQECMCMRARVCTILFRRVREPPITHTGKLANIRNLPCFMFRHEGSVTFEMPCVYYTVYALRVFVLGDYRQLLRHGVNTVRYTVHRIRLSTSNSK
jgi:hypothetical protein